MINGGEEFARKNLSASGVVIDLELGVVFLFVSFRACVRMCVCVQTIVNKGNGNKYDVNDNAKNGDSCDINERNSIT